ncbi:MAG TPA: penicillin acylase family protein, partial [Parasegetibacter sp.]
MKKPILLLLTATLFHFLAPAFSVAQNFSDAEIKRWNKQAKNVTIIRDTWGIPHVYGKTDADCVFGIMYAQCEDDFRRVENGYIDMLGRSAEVKGKNNIYNDVYTRLVIDSAEAVEDYHNSPAWLKKLLHAFADGMNYFLYKNPHVKPALIQRFEPWYPLLWTDGSMGHINTAGVTVTEVRKFYSALESAGSGMSATGAGIFASGELDDDYAESSDGVMTDLLRDMHSGSNGFAIAPSKSESGNAMLFINPHVSFYYRPEVHVISKEGLNAYGALTWGQFFVYQGFNERLGWMHTSGYSDVADAYEEEVVKKGDSLYYLYEGSLRPVKKKIFRIKYKEGNEIKEQEVTGYFTHHGPVMANRNGKWISVKALNRNINGLLQSWLRTKARNFAEFKQTMEFKANPTNNTMYADSDGNISYWHGNVIPKRDTSFNWLLPVDGTIAATEWKGMHALDEIVQVHNPSNGWIQNCNSTPFAAAGANSPRKEDYPFYMATEAENFRGINALRI